MHLTEGPGTRPDSNAPYREKIFVGMSRITNIESEPGDGPGLELALELRDHVMGSGYIRSAQSGVQSLYSQLHVCHSPWRSA